MLKPGSPKCTISQQFGEKNILSILLSGFLLLESSGSAAACESPKDIASGWAKAEFVPAVGFCDHTLINMR